MSKIRPWRTIERRKSKKIMVGNVPVGGNSPITVQSMTNTPTTDVEATVAQIKALEEAGADIVRVSCPDVESTAVFGKIVEQVKVPIVADIHFHYKRALEAADAGAACLRINPGNIGSKERVMEIVQAAKANGCSIRIGVNGGSLEKHLLDKYGEPCPDALVESALTSVHLLEDCGFDQIKISVKASDLFMAVAAYHTLADACEYPFHMGITEAGPARLGTVKSSIGIGSLLWAGVGDTIRVSLSADPVEEIKVGFDMLKSLGLRHRGVNIIACPSCARQQFPVIETVTALEQRIAHISTPMSISIIGCVVNGPGEAMETDIGLTGGGQGNHLLYLGGVKDHKVSTKDMVEHLAKIIEAKAADIEAEAADIEAKAADIETEAADIEAEAADIETEAADIETEAADIKAEAADIETEAADIETEAADIKTEAADIEAEAADIETEAADIEAEAADIETEAADIETEAADIETEVADIETEAADIETEAADIETEAADIETEAADIETEAADIEAKAADIEAEA